MAIMAITTSSSMSVNAPELLRRKSANLALTGTKVPFQTFVGIGSKSRLRVLSWVCKQNSWNLCGGARTLVRRKLRRRKQARIRVFGHCCGLKFALRPVMNLSDVLEGDGMGSSH